jgi:hypothetical protein
MTGRSSEVVKDGEIVWHDNTHDALDPEIIDSR